jgi:hypothetical protein
VFCLLVGGGFAVHVESFIHSASRTHGQVIDLAPRTNNDNDVEYAPIFRFVAENGQAFTVTSSVSSNPAGFEVGETVEVLYRKDDPVGAQIASFWQLWFIPVIFGAIGVVHGLIGVAALFVLRRRDRRIAKLAGATA